jgi:hypothetical protein
MQWIRLSSSSGRMYVRVLQGAIVLLLITLCACGGNYGGSPVGAGTGGSSGSGAGAGAGSGSGSGSGSGGGSGNSANVTDPKDFFITHVEPNMGFCRTCHVPGGVGDTDKGHRFMLSSNSAEDYAHLNTSWMDLNKGVETNRILLKPSGQDPESHSGGTPWPKGSVAYADMKTLLGCWDNPASCGALLGTVTNVPGGTGSGSPVTQPPLLGSMHGGHAWFNFCEGKLDDAVLPPDPRSLIRPGVNKGKAVYYNTYWKDCHVNPGAVHERAHPKTCGELRETAARGATLMKGNGAVG